MHILSIISNWNSWVAVGGDGATCNSCYFTDTRYYKGSLNTANHRKSLASAPGTELRVRGSGLTFKYFRWNELTKTASEVTQEEVIPL